MADGKLAILMPTYRFDATARHCIETAASMASEEIEVYIGDNSCNPEKWAYLRKLSERSAHLHACCHETNLGSGGNWAFLMNTQSHEYLCMASDDDVFTPDYFLAGYEELKRNPSCAAAAGLVLVQTWHGNHMHLESAVSNLHSTPLDRIAAYTGFNTIPYAVHRRAGAASQHAYFQDRPYHPSYLDQIFTYSLLAQGTYVVDHKRSIFLYNNTNWGDAEKCAISDASFYISAGLPEQFRHLHWMCWAIDMVHYFNSIYRPPGLSDFEAQSIVELLFNNLFEQKFRAHLLENLPALANLFAHAPEGIKTIQAIIATPCDEPLRLMNLFVLIIRMFNAELADRYQNFYDTSFRPIFQSSMDLAS